MVTALHSLDIFLAMVDESYLGNNMQLGEYDANNERISYMRTPIINNSKLWNSSYEPSPIAPNNLNSPAAANVTPNNITDSNYHESRSKLRQSFPFYSNITTGHEPNAVSTPILSYKHSHMQYNLNEQTASNNTPLLTAPVPPPGFFTEFDLNQQLTPNFTASGITFHKSQQQQQQGGVIPPEFLYSMPPQEQFPATFDPRSAANMPHKEKVNDWITKVPIYCLADGQLWYSECYPGVVPASSSISTEDESVDDLDIFNYNQRLLGNEFDYDEQLFVDNEDVLEFQARRITRYVKKIYKMDSTEHVVKGDKQYINNIDHTPLQLMPYDQSDSNIEITNTSYNLNLTDAFDQIHKKNLKYQYDEDGDLVEPDHKHIDLLKDHPPPTKSKAIFSEALAAMGAPRTRSTPRGISAGDSRYRV